MKLYLLISSYPYQGGYVHGVFSGRNLAEKHLKKLRSEYQYREFYVEEIELDKFEPEHIYVG